MPNLLVLSDSKGLIGSCGRSCYEGKALARPCICGGSNHGIGHQAAALNTLINHQRWADRYRDRKLPNILVQVQLHQDLLDFILNPNHHHPHEA